MKLRNKKTGEIVDFQPFRFYQSDYCKYPSNIFESLSSLNEEWEDYKPKEPLIKDEKIRKVVKTWAELNKIKQVVYVEYTTSTDYCCLADMDNGYYSIKFVGCISALKDCEDYTIAELCGEEE